MDFEISACCLSGDGGHYDATLVGPDGAGHRWQPHEAEPAASAAAAAHFSIAPPPPGPPPPPDDFSDDDSTVAAADEAQEAAVADPEVCCMHVLTCASCPALRFDS